MPLLLARQGYQVTTADLSAAMLQILTSNAAPAGSTSGEPRAAVTDAQNKLSVVISDIFGASGRAMLDALIGGQASPHQLAALARRKMRAKTSALQEALTGHFTEHHAFMLGMRAVPPRSMGAVTGTPAPRSQ